MPISTATLAGLRAVISRIADLIIPPTATPGAVGAGVPAYIDMVVRTNNQHQAVFRDVDLDWLRAWDSTTGEMIPDAEERAEADRNRAEADRKRAGEMTRERNAASKRADEAVKQRDAESKRADEATEQLALLAQRLRDLGIDPDA